MSILFYRRPDYVDKAPGYLNDSACQRYVERTKGSKHKPPMELSFDNILNNRTLPPTTLGDFMDYLMYVAHDAEPLQFYLWYLDYCKRFDALPADARALSPEWHFDAAHASPAGVPFTSEKNEVASTTFDATPVRSPTPVRSFSRLGQYPSQAPQINGSHYHGKSMSGVTTEYDGDFPTLPGSSDDEGLTALPKREMNEDEAKKYVTRSAYAHQMRLDGESGAQGADGLKWSGFTIQPFRAEVTRIISHYLLQSSPRELNLSYTTRASTLHALQHTTHPSAFQPVVSLIETQLRHQSHPNFIRWSICNGNAPKIFFVRTMGVSHTILGFIVAILLTLSHASRWWRILCAPLWFLGIATLVAAYKGLCVVLHSNHTRNLKPWEDPASSYAAFTDDPSNVHAGVNPGSSGPINVDGTPNMSSGRSDSIELEKEGRSSAPSYTDYTTDSYVFGQNNAGYVHEPWVIGYKKKSMLRKTFETSVKVQDQTIRVLQDRIARMGQVWAGIWTIVLTVVFVALPKGNFY